MKQIHLIFDYGHGNNCPGKCSPDRSLFEWSSNREIGRMAAKMLRAKGYDVHEIWCADHEPLSAPGRMCSGKQLDAALMWRAREVNKICDTFGTKNCISVSFHSNAAGGDGRWRDARGYMVMVGATASTASKQIARCIYDEADKRGLRGNRCVPPGHCWPQRLAMCDSTKCPAVLIEALFYDNKEDLAILKSVDGKRLLAEVAVDGLIKYINML